MKLRRHDLERRMAYGLAKELTLFVLHLQEPARPAPSRALDLIGQVAHDRQRLIARSRSVRQLDAFLVRQDALPETEMEKIARHDLCPVHRVDGCSMASVHFRSREGPHASSNRSRHQK